MKSGSTWGLLVGLVLGLVLVALLMWATAGMEYR